MTLHKTRKPGFEVVKGVPDVEKFPLSKAMVIGRKSSADIMPASDYISGEHLRLSIEGGVCYAEDLSSTNRTELNSQEMESGKKYELSNGDELDLASREVVLRFRSHLEIKNPTVSGKVSGTGPESRIKVYPEKHEVVIDGRIISNLPAREFRLLALMYKNVGIVVNADSIKRIGWPDHAKVPEGELPVYVSDEQMYGIMKRLRQRIGDTDHTIIVTVPGVGYKMG